MNFLRVLRSFLQVDVLVSSRFFSAIDNLSNLASNLVDFQSLEGQKDKGVDFAIFQHNFQLE